jgi:transcriptional regulator with XRE-family HTH domain
VPRGRAERQQTHLAAARLRQNTEELVHRARADRTLEALALLNSVERDVELMRAALLQQARAARAPAARIAAAVGVSPGTLARRYASGRLSRQLAAALSTASAPGETFDRTGARPPRDASATAEPGQLFAMALSELVYGTRRSARAIALQAGVDPSYLSRVLSGERRPSWEKTESVTRACQGDVETIRALWEAAVRAEVTRAAGSEVPTTLWGLLRGLHLSAGRPSRQDIERLSEERVRGDDAAALLQGELRPWPVVSAFVAALGGSPAEAMPRWGAAPAHHPATGREEAGA